MIKKAVSFVVIAIFSLMLFAVIKEWETASKLKPLAREYVTREPAELGASNLVTAIVVTYRGLDTLGEVTVLFLAAAGVGLFLKLRDREKKTPRRNSSEILKTGITFVLPAIIMFGVYIFLNGHLTP